MSAVFLRIEKGTADPVELGVLTALLYARARAAAAAAPVPARGTARWRRLERHPGFADPRAWTNTTTG
ncbi:acyl-CoA carboxylase subunit epsilon [Nocardia goodfellowii]|uniref:Acyl-CoA carboxylase subunit epsilon n=1 Tax=Nocardia goodfellowii TaxID=882446 RepID=A0ABS4QHM8_9NOCA|nr:acyl-CoA carboxylase subunit epsilon [Nocardia goodfellowii]MBP2191155.1 hypothetical protein [Nocardia goodfellowii]